MTPTVETSNGPSAGNEARGINRYLGIPYAAPPIGDLRWFPPQLPAGWTAPLEAFEYGGWCTQNELGVYSQPSTTEDCLYLTRWPRYNENGEYLLLTQFIDEASIDKAHRISEFWEPLIQASTASIGG